MPPQSCLQWNHSITAEPDFLAPWQALQNAFDLHQELCPGDFDVRWNGVSGLPPPKLRHCQGFKVKFHEPVIVHFGDEYEPIGTWDTILVSPSLSSTLAPCTAAIVRCLTMNHQPALGQGLQMSHFDVEHCIDHDLEVSGSSFGMSVDQSFSADVPVIACSIMEPFIQMSRLPDDDAGGHVPGPDGLPPAGRPPDFTDNMMARIDTALFPPAILEAYGFAIRTWYIHHVTHTHNDAPRVIQIVGDRGTWTDQIRDVWRDVLVTDEPTAFTLPTPMPARSPPEQLIALDVIISQGLQQLRYSGLVSVQRMDEDEGISQYTIAASFGPFVSGVQIVDAASAFQLCDSSSGRACSIFFGSELIPLDHHPGHRMRPGNSFMVQVPRDPHLNTGQAAAFAATSSAVIAHGLPGGQVEQHHDFRPPGDDPEHPDDQPPSTPSSWHPGAAAGPTFNCHIYRLRHPPLHLFLRNAGGVPMLMELARHLQVVPASLLKSHAMHVQMVGETQTDWSYIVQSIADLPSASSDALVIIDVELHFHPLAGPVQPLPASTRRVCRVPQFLTRLAVLRYAGVSQYCHRQHDRCLVQFNNVAWPLSHRGPHRVRHGVYLRVIVPPPDDGSNTLQAVYVAEQPLVDAAAATPFAAPAMAPGSASAPAPAPILHPTSGGNGVFRPNFEPAPLSARWHDNLRDAFVEQALVEHDDEGPILYVWTWMINHNSHVHCACPRIVRLDQMDHLWLHDLYEPWRDLLQLDAPTDIRIVHPRPPHASTAMDTLHVMIEQHPQEAVAAGVVSTRFHGPYEDRLLQGAHSLRRWICVEDLIDLLHINHICEVQRLYCLCRCCSF